MPELPEVEVVKLFLEDKLLGQKITKIDILNSKSFIGNPEQVVGQKIIKFSRIGKQLSVHLSNGKILLVHLKMTGQLILIPLSSKGVPEGQGILMGHPTKIDSMPNKSTRLVFHFSPPSSRGVPQPREGVLFFNDQRKFGWVQVFDKSSLNMFQEDLGHDIFDPLFTPEYLYTQLQRSSRAVKLILLDQHFFAGIGNIYANDALFLSKVHPSTPAHKITPTQSHSIHKNMILIMRQSVLAGGSTMKDNLYIRPDGSTGANQFHFQVYGRAGEPCLVCQTKIKRIVIGGRGTFFCPHCQTP
ncbi:MAG: bifunctional DNA-formamidopyrimidine glycosylase/DNA-(apurinic or apyrimidinic site) lyase [Microgenomates group bacterium]